MKRISFCMACTGFILLGCQTPEVSGIAGRYTARYHTDYTLSEDTLSIRVVAGRRDQFLIDRSLRLQFTGPYANRNPAYRQMHWVAEYQADRKILHVQNSGRELWYYPGSDQVMMGRTRYTKIK